MYLPTAAARQLATTPGLPNLPSENVVALCTSPRKSLFCLLTRNGVAVHRVRPTALMSFLSRTPTSVIEHGENVAVYWAPDSSRLVITTANSYLVLVTLHFDAVRSAYESSENTNGPFGQAPGEGVPLQSMSMRFEGVVRIHGNISAVSPRKHNILFSTLSPPTIQRIPWPDDEDTEGPGSELKQGHEMWVFNDYDFEWFVDPDVAVTDIAHSQSTGVEAWITSDGRVYFVRLDQSTSQSSESSLSVDEEGEPPEDYGHRAELSFASDNNDRGGQPRPPSFWQGTLVHTFNTPKWVQKQRRVDPSEELHPPRERYSEPRKATRLSINGRFSLIAVGMISGAITLTSFPSSPTKLPASTELQAPLTSPNNPTGPVTALEWSSDGYVLAVGWKRGWGLYSVGGRCIASSVGESSTDVFEPASRNRKWTDYWMGGVRSFFWAPGNFELFVLAEPTVRTIDGTLFSIPFAKSATTSQHAPDNTRYAFLQMEDRALVYRGADQPDMSVINPESDVWQHIKIPPSYLAHAHPIKYSCLSSDGRLIAVAGRRGLIHYSSTSGRWKIFADSGDEGLDEEMSFTVRGGMVWFHHVLAVGVELTQRKGYQIRLYSRDLALSPTTILHVENLPSPVVILSLVDNSLLAYTADNTLYHYLIVPTKDGIKLHLCGSITFEGIIQSPGMVRCLSWMIPGAQKQLGDPVHDLSVATVLMVVGGQLLLLRPRKSGAQEVKYDMQIFAERIEFCWIHLRGIAALENSLWAYDGTAMRIWLNALNIEKTDLSQDPESDEDAVQRVKESVKIELDFYPLSVLMDKGIIIGAEHETVSRSNLPFVMFRHSTSSNLFLHHILLYYLTQPDPRRPAMSTSKNRLKDAVVFAAHYQNLVYFAHALEILLHEVIENEPITESSSDTKQIEGADDSQEEAGDGDSPKVDVLHTVVDFLDHFDCALDVVVGCARKTEMTRWRRLFDVVGSPQSLFETCLSSSRLKTAGSYLLVLHNLEQLEPSNQSRSHSGDAVRLLQRATQAKEWELARELLRFLHSIDDTGAALRKAMKDTGMLDEPVVVNGSY